MRRRALWMTMMVAACAGSDPDVAGEPEVTAPDTFTPAPPKPAGLAVDEPEEADITFTDVSGLLKLTPSRVMGVALVDYDGDGWVDVTLGDMSGLRLFRNRGDGTFEDVGGSSGLRDLHLHSTRGPTWADIDGDGDLDIFVTRISSPDALLLNDGGRFVDASDAWGLADRATESHGASAGDLDGDGDLDVYVAIDRHETDKGTVDGAPNILWRNDGDHFTDVTAEANAGASEEGQSFGSLLFDTDDDGDLDIFVVQDFDPDEFLLNDGTGHFYLPQKLEYLWGEGSGLMGMDLGDVDGDGHADIYATNYGPDHILRRQPNVKPAFKNVMRQAMGDAFDPTAALVGWGCALADIDDDGDPDLVSTASYTDAAPGVYQQGMAPSLDPSLIRPGAMVVIENRGGDLGHGSLADVTEEAGPRLTAEINGFGLAVGDIDRDGDLDMAAGVDRVLHSQIDDTDPAIRHVSFLLRNDGRRAANNQSLQLLLKDPTSPNRFAVGARVTLRAAGRQAVRYVLAGSSYLSTNTYWLHFGLGSGNTAQDVRITWPGGEVQHVGTLTAGEHVIERAP